MHWYLIAIGSNRRSRIGSPRALLTAWAAGGAPLCALAPWREIAALAPRHKGAKENALISRVLENPPIGPGKRRYANAVAVLETSLGPLALLAALKSIERAYGRRPGRRWGDRVLDLDIIGWSGGIWASKGLSIPHQAFRERRFVLAPLVEIAPGWRDPVTSLTARHLLARLDHKRPRA